MSTPADLAHALFSARSTRVPIAPLTDADPAMTADEAYAIQRELVDLLMADGGEIVGYKLGITSKPIQEWLDVHEPDYGPILSSMVFDDGASVDLDGTGNKSKLGANAKGPASKR